LPWHARGFVTTASSGSAQPTIVLQNDEARQLTLIEDRQCERAAR
jgi:hypothetical protein